MRRSLYSMGEFQLPDSKIDIKAELVKMYNITLGRIEKLEEYEKTKGKVEPELRLEITQAMKLLEMIRKCPEEPPKEIKVSWDLSKLDWDKSKAKTNEKERKD